MSVQSELQNGSTFTIALPITWAVSNRNKDT
jgi:chemotaxis protein histidine kinase CheA